MNVIYIDSFFLLNLTTDYLILLAAGRIASLPLIRWRILLAALLGGLYAVACVLWNHTLLHLATVKLLLAATMVLIAYGFTGKPLRNFAIFLILSAAFGGAVWACSFLGISSANSGIFLPISMKTLLFSFIACYATVTLVFRHAGRKADRTLFSITLTHNGKTVQFSALQDTGNELRDPLSGYRVMVVDAPILASLFPSELQTQFRTASPMELVELLSCCGGCNTVRLIPYSAVGISQNLLAAFRPDTLLVNGTVDRTVLVAISPSRLCADEEFSAVL
ncbi:MAG: sigma-E processing peptidase SpoIIGA [Oscillospiraceae bacterium]|jgi:stage II sporulation protein GA (sporulation sigma-E factor processing peptidase)